MATNSAHYFNDLHDTEIRSGHFSTIIGGSDDPNNSSANYFEGGRRLTISGGNYTTIIGSPSLSGLGFDLGLLGEQIAAAALAAISEGSDSKSQDNAGASSPVIVATRPTPDQPLSAPPAHFTEGPVSPVSPVPATVAFQHTNVDFFPHSHTQVNYHPSGLDVPNHRPVDNRDMAAWIQSSGTGSAATMEVLGEILGKAALSTFDDHDENNEEALGGGGPSSSVTAPPVVPVLDEEKKHLNIKAHGIGEASSSAADPSIQVREVVLETLNEEPNFENRVKSSHIPNHEDTSPSPTTVKPVDDIMGNKGTVLNEAADKGETKKKRKFPRYIGMLNTWKIHGSSQKKRASGQ